VTAGQAVYLNSSDGKVWKAACDLGTAANRCIGLALSAAGADQWTTVQSAGTIKIGATAAILAGSVYVLTDTAGGIANHLDLDDAAATERCCIIGIGDADDNIVLGIQWHDDPVA
jgi:hypothetical protein